MYRICSEARGRAGPILFGYGWRKRFEKKCGATSSAHFISQALPPFTLTVTLGAGGALLDAITKRVQAQVTRSLHESRGQRCAPRYILRYLSITFLELPYPQCYTGVIP
jgi:hypothetical protein